MASVSFLLLVLSYNVLHVVECCFRVSSIFSACLGVKGYCMNPDTASYGSYSRNSVQVKKAVLALLFG